MVCRNRLPNLYQPGSQQAIIQGGAANGCDSIINLNITFLTPTSVIAPPPNLGCDPGSSVTLDGTGSSSGNNVSYNWTTYNGGVVQQPTNQNTVVATAPGNYILTVSQSNASGTVTCIARDTVQVMQQTTTINDPVFTGAQTTICEGDIVTYTISPVTGATSYTWTVPTGATFTGSGTSITVDFGTATGGQVCVTARGDCAASAPVCLPITINPIPTSDFTVDSPICQDSTSTIVYTGNASPFATYTWTLNGGQPSPISGPGPHEIQWGTTGPKTVTLIVEEDGCTSTQTSNTVTVEAPLPPPVISCDPSQTAINFTWTAVPGANDYEVIINGTSMGTQTATNYNVTGLNPGDNVDITVIANGTTACGPSMASSSCIAQDCPPIMLNIDPVANICRDANTGTITLVSNPTGGAGNGTFVWSGPATTPAGVFDPTAANAGSNTISLTYTEGTCMYTEAITINVNDIPTSDFSVDSPICVTETSTITYLGTASGTATFTWDFAGGTIVSGMGAGPYEIQWATAGTYDVTLSVTENGCTSPVTTMQVQVDPELAPPVLNCVTGTTTEVVIGWNPVPGATSYTVNLLSGEAGTYDPNTLTYTSTNLSPGDSVEIQVIANGTTACGTSSTSIKCFASPCPNLTVNIDPIGPFCDDGTGVPVNLTATTGDNSGTYTWSGTGVDPATMTFNPNAPSVNPGTLTIRATYVVDNCTYTGTLPVIINEQPTATFTVTDVICVDETSTVTYTGTADPGANYAWDFDGGTIVSGAGAGPYEIQWAAPGNYNITLTVTENNCPSNQASQPVQVDGPLPAPVISCDQHKLPLTLPGQLFQVQPEVYCKPFKWYSRNLQWY
ncbi:MAG: PKD domain-containing protein [Saprospiraceae bacterium]